MHEFQASSFRATKQKRRKIVPHARSTGILTLNALGQSSGGVLERLGIGSGTLLGVPRPPFGSPGASQDRPGGGFWSSWTCPYRVPARPRNGFKHPKPARIKLYSICHRFSSIFCGFSARLGRFWHRLQALKLSLRYLRLPHGTRPCEPMLIA